MKFLFITALAVAARANSVAAGGSKPCRASCVDKPDGKECTFEVSRNQYASELGYFKFSGENGDCGGTNPTLGVEKGATYYFIQKDPSNYYHPIGFAYAPDGALKDNNELEPGVSGPEGDDNGSCKDTLSCPAPMYIKDGEYLGNYTNNPKIGLGSQDLDPENFGLDDYEPEYFYPLYDWLGADYKVALLYPEDNDYEADFFYFCHIHEFMTGRIKFIDSDGNPIQQKNFPKLGYEYEKPGPYDQSCGTSGLEHFQLPNKQCPEKFVCNKPDGAVGKFAECVDSMNCAMLAGMTSNVNYDDAIGLFNHQMIPHHQNAVNMCKALLNSGEADCDDLANEDDPACITNVICQEIINVQNAQIQTMRGVLEGLNLSPSDDCLIEIKKSKEVNAIKNKKKKKKKKNKKPHKSF